MRILQVHNRYVDPSGEDAVVNLEGELLRQHGHCVEQFQTSNEGLEVGSVSTSISAGLGTIWSRRTYRSLEEVIHRGSFDLPHAHNTFPQLSPSVYWAAARHHLPVIQTLHNYRVACANGLLMRDGHPCEDCVGRLPLPALQHRCYRGTLLATGAVIGMQAAHRAAGTYANKVDAYIALSDFAKSIMVRSGLPKKRVHVKPHSVPDVSATLGSTPERDNQVVFVARLQREKGADLLLRAWKQLKPTNFRLVIVGDGPERVSLEREFSDLPGVVWRGWLGREDVLHEIARSRCLAMTSRAYETFGMVLIEAFSAGTPVIAPNHAGFPEIVTPGSNGLLFSPRNVDELAKALGQLLCLKDSTWQEWSANARRTYLACYTPHANYRRLMTIYKVAAERARSRVNDNGASRRLPANVERGGRASSC
jgi:glycosyltransferase involved in cell wall biosynthesis